MPRIPGTRNGGVPANIQWDEDNPPVKNSCSNMAQVHADGCDGSCDKIEMTESEVRMLNEFREWARLGVDPRAVIARDMYKMGNQLQAIINTIKKMGVTQEELDEEYRECTINELQRIRADHEDEFKRMKLGLPPSGLLGPTGQPL